MMAEEAEQAISQLDSESDAPLNLVRTVHARNGYRGAARTRRRTEIAKRIEDGPKHMVKAPRPVWMTIAETSRHDKIEKDEVPVDDHRRNGPMVFELHRNSAPAAAADEGEGGFKKAGRSNMTKPADLG